MALNSLFCADVPLSNYSLTHSLNELHAINPTVGVTKFPEWYSQSERYRHYQPVADWSHVCYTRTSSWWWRL